MAHTHSVEDRNVYYVEQLCMIGFCGALGIVQILLYHYKVLEIILTSKFHIWVLLSGIVLTGLAVIRAGVLWVSAGRHNHEHDHNHDGIDRRGFLKCMAWAGTGALCAVQGGVLICCSTASSRAWHTSGRIECGQFSVSSTSARRYMNQDCHHSP